MLLIFIGTLSCVGVTLKIWNTTRLEMKLAEQEMLVVRSRLDALSNQINPHFLFNTLNSISSLIRTNPNTARTMVIKLSHILRKLLHGHENFVPLREELEFIDNYLDIEVMRFGRDKLLIEKEVESNTLGVMIPSMILQPIIENSIKHGIGPKIQGGGSRFGQPEIWTKSKLNCRIMEWGFLKRRSTRSTAQGSESVISSNDSKWFTIQISSSRSIALRERGRLPVSSFLSRKGCHGDKVEKRCPFPALS